MRIHSIAAFVAALFLAHAAPGLARETTNSVSFTMDRFGAVVVPVIVNGVGPFQFVVDTGTNRSALTDRCAARLGLSAVARTANVTAAGRAMHEVVRLSRITVGTVGVNDVLAMVIPEPEFHALAPGLDGVLGQDFLVDLDYTLDYRRRRLVWDDPTAGQTGEARLTLRREEGRWLVELPQDRGRSVWFVPDSGVTSIVVFERPGAGTVELQPSHETVEVATLSGRRDAALKRWPSFRIGDILLRDQRVVVVERPEADAPGGQGLLPLQLFASVSFNARGSYLVARAR